jgi:hypothetical protein
MAGYCAEQDPTYRVDASSVSCFLMYLFFPALHEITFETSQCVMRSLLVGTPSAR